MSHLKIPEIQETKEVDICKNKKGRPRKIQIETVNYVEPEKKKRGRKKKEKVEEEVKIKKKRGRKAALKFFSSTIRKRIPLTTIIHDTDKSILHLDIKEDESLNNNKFITYDVLKSEIQHSPLTNDNDILEEYLDLDESKVKVDIRELYEKRLQSRLIQDNTLIKNLDKDDIQLNKLVNNVNPKVIETEVKVDTLSEDRKKGFFGVLHRHIANKEWIDNTDVCCWWCCHAFNSIPIGLPIDYRSGKFRVKGIFCSFACMLAYNPDCNINSRSMINSLYKKLTGGVMTENKENFIENLNNECKIKKLFNENEDKLQKEYVDGLCSIDSPISKAPVRCSLKMFGGGLSIEEFRNSTKERKVYKMIQYPMYISRDYIEEVDLDNLKKINKSVFSKKNNIISNALDCKKFEEVKNRVDSAVTVTGNYMDKFIRF